MTRRETVAETMDRLVEEVGEWRHVTVGDHRFGGTEFRIGSREFGHVHAWGMLDIAFFRALRDGLVDRELTGVHHLLTDSGWTTYHVESPDDYDHALWLLRLSYLFHVNVLAKTPSGVVEFGDVDVAAELTEMGLDADLLAAFERRRPDGSESTPEVA
jgi:hypothetical protein